jgi:hypothetical protein
MDSGQYWPPPPYMVILSAAQGRMQVWHGGCAVLYLGTSDLDDIGREHQSNLGPKWQLTLGHLMLSGIDHPQSAFGVPQSLLEVKMGRGG